MPIRSMKVREERLETQGAKMAATVDDMTQGLASEFTTLGEADQIWPPRYPTKVGTIQFQESAGISVVTSLSRKMAQHSPLETLPDLARALTLRWWLVARAPKLGYRCPLRTIKLSIMW